MPPAPKAKRNLLVNVLIYGVVSFLCLVVVSGLIMRVTRKARVQSGKTEVRLGHERGKNQTAPPGPAAAPAVMETGSRDSHPKTTGLPAAPAAGEPATAHPKQPDVTQPGARPIAGGTDAIQGQDSKARAEGKMPVGKARVSIELAGPIMAGGFGIFVDGEPRIQKEIHGAVNKRNPEKQGFRVRENLELTAGTHTLRFAVKAARSGSMVLIKDWTVSPKAGDHLHIQVMAFPRKATLVVKEVPGFESLE